MSWIEELYRTYENNVGHIGDQDDEEPLLPMYHWIQNAQIEIAIDAQGNFLRAGTVPLTDAPTIIPATEDSANRAGAKIAAHPLCDKLRYVAGDFSQFGGKLSKGFAGRPRAPHEDYLRELSGWCMSPQKHHKVCAVLSYVKRRRVIADLVGAGVLPIGSDRKLLNSGPGAGDPFVRWMVEVPGDPQSKLWTDPTAWKSWADYYAMRESAVGLCYVTGEVVPLAKQHPKRIRNGGDGAKLISSNDESGFTFRGRFVTAEEACGVSFDVTQKAHNALRWLLAHQGFVEYVRDGRTRKPALAVVAWAVSGAEIPDPFLDTSSLLSRNGSVGMADQAGYTAQEMGSQLTKLIAGYSVKLGPTDDVVVLALDSATPGRMAIRFYRELTGSEFLDRVKAWHDIENGCTWFQKFDREKRFFGAPAPKDIAEAAYGTRPDDRLQRATTERLLPCITDGAPMPRDLVESCARRASHRSGSRTGSTEAQRQYWEWEKALGIACALYRYYHKERRYKMPLEPDRKTRDYLYGRLLALADHLEGRALRLAHEERDTNAARLMQRFADRPLSTWRTIELSLSPYKARLRSKRPGLLLSVEREIDEVFEGFAPDDFRSDAPLSGEFLLGFHCQRSSLWEKPSNQDPGPEGSPVREEDE